mmetsp:Transcript_12627/g.21030  ORF Transcript_12627/g.21030 Transcript_12627/m.21030 type:complete len:185 (-) Transcript_12627:80-634(-)|eukprot:CAMPEP_0197727500 /NCGR_PEP_ID=MMETSP1434-20131217/20741_1 /TAXON_ID=265543 /ORGANISM="Minutocellus polymorphus, Strain CCMP3303" /LENGTH=184 /DNA_ID=CAMNT_0043313709 /DNA_START=47 /DNA_END=601 /DNA_ORIENTATION=-
MEDILKLATDCGMTKDQGEKTTGGIFSLLKNQLDAPQFKQMTDKIPGSEKLIDDFLKSQGGAATGEAGTAKKGGSALTGLMGMFGEKKKPAEAALEGGDRTAASTSTGSGVTSVTDLLGVLNKQGVSTSDATSFLPKLTKMIQDKAGVDVGSVLGGVDMKKLEGIASSIPGGKDIISKIPLAPQ